MHNKLAFSILFASLLISILFASLLIYINCPILSAENNYVQISYNKEKGIVNKMVYGNNFIGYDPTTFEKPTQNYYGYSDYGAGIWDPRRGKSVSEVISLAKGAGVVIVRFPGGGGANRYDWKTSIGNRRVHFLYGLDEFLRTCEEVGADVIFTVSYFSGDEHDAADLVEYLNSPNDGTNPNGGIDWAAERSKNGHNLPYNIIYFEIGNEVWGEISPEEYIQKYIKYYTAMKSIDKSIMIGFGMQPDNWNNWNRIVIRGIGGIGDFAIPHVYPGGFAIPAVDAAPKETFKIILGESILKEISFMNSIVTISVEENNIIIPLAVTEYNIGLDKDEPFPYRHCLGAALLNAELIKVFMNPESNVLMANYWTFVNDWWGMIANKFDGTYRTLYNPYYKRPNYYVFEMYHKHFGEILIDASVLSDSYEVNGNKIPYLSVNTSKSKDGNKIYLMVINKNMDGSIISPLDLKDFVPAAIGNAWVLNGPSVDATNEVNYNNVKITQKRFEIRSNPCHFTFEPHSLTAIELTRALLLGVPSSTLPSVGDRFTFDTVCQPLIARFDAYGVIITPEGKVYSFDLKNPAKLHAGIRPLALSVAGIRTVYRKMLYIVPSIPPDRKGNTFTFILGLVPAGAKPSVADAIPGYLWQGTVSVR